MRNMSHDQILATAAMVKRLDDWAATVASRDALIQDAHAAGLSNTTIAAHMKISRNTVIAVLGTDDESSEEAGR